MPRRKRCAATTMRGTRCKFKVPCRHHPIPVDEITSIDGTAPPKRKRRRRRNIVMHVNNEQSWTAAADVLRSFINMGAIAEFMLKKERN